MKYIYFIFLLSLAFLLGGIYGREADKALELQAKRKTVLEKVITKIRNANKLDTLQITLNVLNENFKIAGKNKEKKIVRLIELLNSANVKNTNKKDSTLHIQLKVNKQEFNYYLTKSMYAKNIALKNFVNLFVTYANT